MAVRLGVLAFLVYWSFVLVRPFIPILVGAWFLPWLCTRRTTGYRVHLGDRPKLAGRDHYGHQSGDRHWTGDVAWIRPGRWFCKSLLASLAGAPWLFRHRLMASRTGRSSAPGFTSSGIKASTNLRAALKEFAPHLKPLAGPVLAFAGSASLGTLKFVASVCCRASCSITVRARGGHKKDSGALGTQEAKDFVALAGLTIRTIAQGVIGVAVLQSLLAGIGLKLAGVPHAGVLAFLVLILAILQIGSAVVLIPVIIWIWLPRTLHWPFR